MEGSAEHVDQHPLVLLLSACFWVIMWILSWAKWLVAFVTITIPTTMIYILSYSMTLTLNFWSFALIFVLCAVALNYWIRFRYLNDYTQLKEPPLVKPDPSELHPDVNTDPPPSFHNYLDDFLQAVRVFGFLEKPVFHELARHLQTRRLIAGDSIALDQDKSFYCVVEGTVQVYSQTGQTMAQPGAWDDEDKNGYQLLNEVSSGGTLSSLFTILSLFTEDVKMSWQDDHAESPFVASSILPEAISRRSSGRNTDVSSFDLNRRETPSRRRASLSSNASTVHLTSTLSPNRDGFTSTPDEDFSAPQRDSGIYHGLVARATDDTTLAVIPAEAFRRLTKKYPKATGHIVQVILTRFSRVTFNAAHKYLGLTSEVLRTEKVINDIACHPLPNSFYEGGGLQSLRQRFDSTERSDTESDYFSYAHFTESPASLSSKTLSSDTVHSDDASKKVKITDTPRPALNNISTPYHFRNHSSRHIIQAGDLLTSTENSSDDAASFLRSNIVKTPHVSRKSLNLAGNRRAANMSGDDFDLREEVMSCIAKSIGLLQPPLSGSDSVEASPAVQAADDIRSGGGLFTSSFSSLSLLDLNDDSSSATGGSSAMASPGGYMVGLDNEVEMLFFAAGSTLVKAGDLNTGLFYVIEGFLDIFLPADGSDKKSADGSTENVRSSSEPRGPKRDQDQKLLFTVKPGGIAGYLASLTHTASYVDIKAKTDTYVGFLHANALERILEKRPIVLLTLAKRLISLLSPLVLHIDASLDWMQVNAGQVLWRPGDNSDSFYIVINGRLRVITDDAGQSLGIVGEYGQGDTVGELDVILSSPKKTTAHAIRDTELIRMPKTLFNAISARNPQTTAQLLRMIASRVRDELNPSRLVSTNSKRSSETGYNNNLKTVAVLPVSKSVPIEEFSRKLQTALEGIGATTAYLNQAAMSSQLGKHAFTRMGKLKAAGWLADQEQKYRTVLYVADSPVSSPWTQTCIRQADCVMVVGMGDDPSLGEYERLLLSMKTTARKELVLLHPSRSVFPGSTREWLKVRPWIHQHLHVELPGIAMPIPKSSLPKDPDPMVALKNLKNKVQNEIQKYRRTAHDPRPQRLPHTNDFSRIARRLCGKSIGLVLGGGGARGISHLGLIRALAEYGIPIDHIGGTSIGAFIGGLYAREGDILASAGRAKQFSSRMGNIWRMLSDVTYPIVAYTTGHEFNRALYKAFYDLHIEDCWLPFFCNTTNINTSRMEIHETGYAWRFIRGSMSLVGLLPPLCEGGNMLVDGGYVDNLPVAAMFAKGGTSAVFACDVGSIDDNSPRDFGDHVSGWWLLINRWNPFSNARRVPAITEIQSRLAYVSSVTTLEEAKIAPNCFYLAMPVQDYGTLQFSKFEEIEKKGYQAALKFLAQCDETGKLPSAFIDGRRDGSEGTTKGLSARRNSI